MGLGETWTALMESFGGIGTRMQEVGALPLAGLLLVSLLSALLMSALYVTFYEGRATGSQLHRAFPLIGLSVTTIFLAVQFSLPLSLGLLGALSIVRFRTPVKEPEEIGFVLLVIATSLCVATFSLVFLAIVIGVAVLGLLILRLQNGPLRRRGGDGVVVVTVPAGEYESRGAELIALLDTELSGDRLESITTRDGNSVITHGFASSDRTRALALQGRLTDICAGAQTDIYTGAAVA